MAELALVQRDVAPTSGSAAERSDGFGADEEYGGKGPMRGLHSAGGLLVAPDGVRRARARHGPRAVRAAVAVASSGPSLVSICQAVSEMAPAGRRKGGRGGSNESSFRCVCSLLPPPLVCAQ